MDDISQLASAFENNELIAITLEGSTKTYKVSKATLCNISAYFRKALDGDFIEGRTRALRLPGCDEGTFNLFLYWLCNLDLPNDFTMVASPDSGEEKNQVLCVRLWAFGDAFLMPKLQNAAMQRLLRLCKASYTRIKTVQLAYALSPPGSALRKMIILEMTHDMNAASAYLQYTNEDHDTIGAVPGLFADYVSALRSSEGVRMDVSKQPSQKTASGEWDKYKVAE